MSKNSRTDAGSDLVDESTRSSDRADAHKHGSADSPPTAEEERLAEKSASSAPDVSEQYEEMMEVGADVKGEGQIS